jgi:mRNA-degrading endonuclease toxin of MazEF toxin-antitoxin module
VSVDVLRTNGLSEPRSGRSDGTNGLKKASYVMADKLLTVRKSQLGDKVGELTDKQMHEISRALAAVLSITQTDLA